jgi:hypothetical protein
VHALYLNTGRFEWSSDVKRNVKFEALCIEEAEATHKKEEGERRRQERESYVPRPFKLHVFEALPVCPLQIH